MMSVLETFDKELPEKNATFVATVFGMTLFGTWTITFAGILRLVMAVMLAVMVLVVVWATARGQLSATGLDDWGRENQQLAMILLVAAFAALFMLVANFPATIQSKGGFVNFVGHGSGFFTGMVIHYYQSGDF